MALASITSIVLIVTFELLSWAAVVEIWGGGNTGGADRGTKTYLVLARFSGQTDINSAEACERRASEYIRDGDYDRAIQEFTRALKLNSALAGAFYGRGNFLLSQA